MLAPERKCYNCETELARYECLDPSCARDTCVLCGLCDDCDKVFHKASSKRCHVRLPVVTKSNIQVLVHLPIHSGCESGCTLSSFRLLRTKLEGGGLGGSGKHHQTVGSPDKYSSSTLLLIILLKIRRLLDDRQHRNQSVPITMMNELLKTMLHTLKYIIVCPSPCIPTDLTRNDILQEVILTHIDELYYNTNGINQLDLLPTLFLTQSFNT